MASVSRGGGGGVAAADAGAAPRAASPPPALPPWPTEPAPRAPPLQRVRTYQPGVAREMVEAAGQRRQYGAIMGPAVSAGTRAAFRRATC